MRDVEREAVWGKRVAAIGEFIEALGSGRGVTGVDGGTLVRVTIRCPTKESPEALLVVKVSGTEGDKVGFVGALDVGTALLMWRARDGAAGLKWRPDRPWPGAE